MSENSQTAGDANRHLLRGSAWSVTLRWVVRSIGFVSILIIARLLSPEDLGLFAMAIIVAGLLDQMSDMGVTTHLIRVPEATREHCDTAWTMSVLQALIVALGAVALAPVAAWYFEEPRVTAVLMVLAASFLILGFTNVGMTLVRRELDFAKDFRFDLYRRIIRFVSTISLALVLRNYWALVISEVIAAVGGVVLSYRMHTYRPRFSLECAREYLSFGAHVLPIRLTHYFSSRVGLFAVGRLGSTAVLGSFNVVAELANMVIQEVVFPVGRALLPSYAKVSGDHQKLANAWLEMYGFMCATCLALGAGLALVAADAVLLLLGEKWASGIPILPWLAAFATLKGLVYVFNGPILIVSNNERTAMVSAVLEVALLAPIAVTGGILHGVEAVPVAMVAAEAIYLPVSVVLLMRALPVRLRDLGMATLRPVSAMLAMVLALHLIDTTGLESPALRLAVDVPLGALAYVGCMLLLWLACGMPPGPERSVLTAVGARLRPGY